MLVDGAILGNIDGRIVGKFDEMLLGLMLVGGDVVLVLDGNKDGSLDGSLDVLLHCGTHWQFVHLHFSPQSFVLE